MSKPMGFTHEPSNSEKIEWYTPPNIFEKLSFTFDLDVCSAGEGKDHVPARSRYTKEDNGLIQPWHGTVWCNPPYGKYTAKWLRLMAKHDDGIALVFARTGTKWWHEVVPTTNVVCFISGRLRFINGNDGRMGSSAGSDSVLLAWGGVATEVVLASKIGLCAKVIV